MVGILDIAGWAVFAVGALVLASIVFFWFLGMLFNQQFTIFPHRRPYPPRPLPPRSVYKGFPTRVNVIQPVESGAGISDPYLAIQGVYRYLLMPGSIAIRGRNAFDTSGDESDGTILYHITATDGGYIFADTTSGSTKFYRLDGNRLIAYNGTTPTDKDTLVKV